MPINPNALLPGLAICYVAWRMYLRIRRHIGRQPLQPKGLIYRIVIYCVIVLLIGASAAIRNISVLTGLGGGLLLGAALALIGLRLTVFETTPEGRFYRPNTYIGVGLSMLLVARVAYRIVVLYSVSPETGPPSAALVQSPLTLSIFGLLFGYYVAYYAGILARANREKQAQLETPAQ